MKLKAFFHIFFAALISILLFLACSKSKQSAKVLETTSKKTYLSNYYNEIVSINNGAFLTLEAGEPRSGVRKKILAEALKEEGEDYLHYMWQIDNLDFYLDIFFNERDKLKSYDAYVYFLDKNNNPSQKEAIVFYEDMKETFIKKYGKTKEVIDEDLSYSSWNTDKQDIELGIDGNEVYWYLYSYPYNN